MNKLRASFSGLLCSFLCASLLIGSGCSTIRMSYDAHVQTTDGHSGDFEYEASYDVGSYPVLCGLTAIFFGGACWFYVVMPTSGQKTQVKHDAEAKLDALMSGREYTLSEKETHQLGWGDSASKNHLTLPPSVAPAAPAPQGEAK